MEDMFLGWFLFLLWSRAANVLLLLVGLLVGLGASSVYVDRALYLLGETLLLSKQLLVSSTMFVLAFLLHTSIHCSLSKPPHCQLVLLAAKLALSLLLLLLSSDALLANPPILVESSCLNSNVTPVSLHILLGLHPL